MRPELPSILAPSWTLRGTGKYRMRKTHTERRHVAAAEIAEADDESDVADDQYESSDNEAAPCSFRAQGFFCDDFCDCNNYAPRIEIY